MDSQVSNNKNKQQIIFAVLFFAIFIAGIFYVKWYPYYGKAITAASTHSVGDSIIAGVGAKSAGVSLQNGFTFTITYFLSVWKALAVAIIVGSLVQVLIPVRWVRRYLGGTKLRNTLIGTLMGVPTMMCTCCSAPVTVGLSKSKASVNSIMAFFLANPLLNPATLIFMGLVLGWKYTIFRIVFGILMVISIATLVGKLSTKKQVEVNEGSEFDPVNENSEALWKRWWKAFYTLIIDSIPAYVVIVFLLGTFEGVLFPAIQGGLSGGWLAVLLFALVGTIFVVPTAGEIPIIQALMALGLTAGPTAALLMTLPAVSIVSLALLKPVLSWKSLGITAASVFAFGLVAGLVGVFVL
ncbi:permease [Companilactobacillus mishanensis]|uniref:Permease n=1 Tax=Companilactobacillus mishanensis TaxID=2486008 RepID=A0ABW9P499_9LACO|nr:permease [Companilactobacillus mishanensis]MQS43937.1 permease [Companilactobacillus mishanensis]